MRCLAVVVISWSFICCPGVFAQDNPGYRLEPVSDGLYRFVAGNYRAMLWVTDEGMLLVDPLNREAATWLKQHLAERFDVPLRYVVYSHNHFDHAYGGDVFDDPAVTFIAHEMARDDLVRSQAQTRLPRLTFSDQMTIHLGGERLTMRYHGPNNGYGSLSFLFEDQRVLFVVDWILVGRVPYRDLAGYDLEGMIRSTRQVLDDDGWETFVGGHADVGDRAGVQRYLDYLETLYGRVLEGMQAGKPLEVLQREITLDAFADLKQFDAWRAENIAGAYRMLADRSYLLMRPETPEPATDGE